MRRGERSELSARRPPVQWLGGGDAINAGAVGVVGLEQLLLAPAARLASVLYPSRAGAAASLLFSINIGQSSIAKALIGVSQIPKHELEYHIIKE